jgi:mRNA interferase MazF
VSSPKLFGIYTVKFPFLDTQEAKIRPVIIISKPQGIHGVLAVIPVSSRTKLEEVDVAIARWSESGLVRPSVARIHRLTTILRADIIAELGEVAADDKQNLRQALKRFLDF